MGFNSGFKGLREVPIYCHVKWLPEVAKLKMLLLFEGTSWLFPNTRR